MPPKILLRKIQKKKRITEEISDKLILMIPSYSEVLSLIKEERISCKDLVEKTIETIEKNADLNAFIEVFSKSALIQAEKVDLKIKSGSEGKLAGMIIGLKDNICYLNHEVTASSRILKGFKSLFNATVVERLIREDAIIIGRLGCDEFAMGSSNENSTYGPVKNPLDKTKVPGGSSGGASAAVSAGLCHVALGSDTGGSIRQPASFTGIIGLKPTYGRVSRHGLIAYASSFDQIGPFGTSVSDISKVLQVISGKDEFDGTLSFNELNSINDIPEIKEKLRFAYYGSYVNHKGLDPEIKVKFFNLLERLQKEGHEVVEKEFKYLDFLVPTYYVLTTAEASSNLARYDGIHFGFRSKNAHDLESTYVLSRSEGFGAEVKRRIMLGTYVLSEGFHDAYYTKAQKLRRIISNETRELLNEVDFILSPTSPHTAFEIGSQNQDPIKMYLEDIFTVQANISGNPAISLPMGKHSNGMPFGIQVTGKHFEENRLLSAAEYLTSGI